VVLPTPPFEFAIQIILPIKHHKQIFHYFLPDKKVRIYSIFLKQA